MLLHWRYSLCIGGGNFIMNEWVKISNSENYLINKIGVIKVLPRKSTGTFTSKEHYLKGETTKHGYVSFKIKQNDGSYKRCTQHRLIALAFIKNPKNKKTVNHINGIRNDNRIENLEWATHSENAKHGYNSGRKNPRRKLTEVQALEIKKELKNYKYGMSSILSKKYKVSIYIIGLIKRNKTYINI